MVSKLGKRQVGITHQDSSPHAFTLLRTIGQHRFHNEPLLNLMSQDGEGFMQGSGIWDEFIKKHIFSTKYLQTSARGMNPQGGGVIWLESYMCLEAISQHLGRIFSISIYSYFCSIREKKIVIEGVGVHPHLDLNLALVDLVFSLLKCYADAASQQLLLWHRDDNTPVRTHAVSSKSQIVLAFWVAVQSLVQRSTRKEIESLHRSWWTLQGHRGPPSNHQVAARQHGGVLSNEQLALWTGGFRRGPKVSRIIMNIHLLILIGWLQNRPSGLWIIITVQSRYGNCYLCLNINVKTSPSL